MPSRPQQDVQPAIAEDPPAAVADRAATDAIVWHAAGSPVDPVEVSGGLSSSSGRHHFLAATSRSMALASIASASSFFSLVFSSSSASAGAPPVPPSRRIWLSICRASPHRSRACGTPPLSSPCLLLSQDRYDLLLAQPAALHS